MPFLLTDTVATQRIYVSSRAVATYSPQVARGTGTLAWIYAHQPTRISVFFFPFSERIIASPWNLIARWSDKKATWWTRSPQYLKMHFTYFFVVLKFKSSLKLLCRSCSILRSPFLQLWWRTKNWTLPTWCSIQFLGPTNCSFHVMDYTSKTGSHQCDAHFLRNKLGLLGTEFSHFIPVHSI
jgi:hypothetical protein